MNPDVFIESSEVIPLIQAFCRLAGRWNSSNLRRAILKNAGVDDAFISLLKLDTSPLQFANELIADFQEYAVLDASPDYHPLLQILKFLTTPGQMYLLQNQEQALFLGIIRRGQNNIKALAVSKVVGRVESPLEHAIGTAILVGPDVLLTCSHIFEGTEGQQLWVRFGYTKEDNPGTFYELDPDFMWRHPNPDHTLLRIKGEYAQKSTLLKKQVLDCQQDIYMLHYPQRKPLVFSDRGQIVKVSGEYIDHTIPAKKGSSGAPIFDKDWQLIALHRGSPTLRRQITLGTTEGIPLSALWGTLERFGLIRA